jgi:hypothetical protein
VCICSLSRLGRWRHRAAAAKHACHEVDGCAHSSADDGRRPLPRACRAALGARGLQLPWRHAPGPVRSADEGLQYMWHRPLQHRRHSQRRHKRVSYTCSHPAPNPPTASPVAGAARTPSQQPHQSAAGAFTARARRGRCCPCCRCVRLCLCCRPGRALVLLLVQRLLGLPPQRSVGCSRAPAAAAIL